jgi:hypothetical protein
MLNAAVQGSRRSVLSCGDGALDLLKEPCLNFSAPGR